MQSKAKANSVITHTLISTHNEAGSPVAAIQFNVIGAQPVTEENPNGVAHITLKIGNLAPQITERAMLHGLIQRVSDAAAISRDTKTGKSATPADKLAAMSEIVEHYNAGSSEWRIARAAGDGIGRSYLLMALVELYPKRDRNELSTWLKARTAEERRGLELDPTVKPVIDRMRAQSVGQVDTGSLLAGLGDEE